MEATVFSGTELPIGRRQKARRYGRRSRGDNAIGFVSYETTQARKGREQRKHSAPSIIRCPIWRRHAAARVCSGRLGDAAEPRQCDGETARMSRNPAFGPKTLAHEFRAAADDIVAVIDARLRPIRVPGRDLRGASRVSLLRSGRQLSPPPNFTNRSLASQTGWANPRATLAAIAMEQVPLP